MGGTAMRVGIVGAGMIGSTLAQLWVHAGHDVRVASRHPETLTPLVERLGTRASAGTPLDAATFGDVVMLTVPLKAVPDLARDLAQSLAGKIVLDTGNAYERRDASSRARLPRIQAVRRAGPRRCFPGAGG
jgi:predicted dinucleotide-binding enzyme